MKKQKVFLILILLLIFLSACTSQPVDNPNSLLTVVAGTQVAAAFQTKRAKFFYSATPTVATLHPTQTLAPTATTYIYISKTPTPTVTATKTPRIITTWPDWQSGEHMGSKAKGSGMNIGSYKKFSALTGLKVIVVRPNGVKLRSMPNKAIGGPIEEEGSAFTLTGVMNKNNEFGWLFAEIIAMNGKIYWVGGSEGDDNTDPTFALDFYYPKILPSVTPSFSLTPTLFTLSSTPTPPPTLTPTP